MDIPWILHAWGLPLALCSCHAYIRHTGNRTDLAQLTDIIRNGGSLRAAAEANPSCYARHARGLQELRSILSRPRSPQEPPRLLWLNGPTGSSKSTTWSTTQTTPIPSTDSTKIPPPNGGVDSMAPNQSSLMITDATCAPFPNYFDSWIVIPCKSKPKGEVLPSILH